MNSKILVDATDLVRWADRLDSQSELPRLIRDLILSSNSEIEKINFAAGEGVSLGGWDGVTIAEEGDGFVPKYTAVWEMGVNKNVKGKADTDYEKRSDNPQFVNPADTTYIFITLRRWGNKEKWTEEKQLEGIWKEVRVYDADDIETWLSQNPTIHIRLSILLGKHPQNCTDLESYWTDWAEETSPSISHGMVLAGRQQISTEISQWLESQSSTLKLQAETRDEAIAVFAASISLLSPKERDFFLSRAIVVKSSDAWSYLSSSQNSLILIPAFNLEGLSRAIRNGHKIMVPLEHSDSLMSDALEIPRLSRERVTEILMERGVDKAQSRELGLLARRGLTTFRRRTAHSPEIRQPLWARPTEARSLIPILLAGAWDDIKQGDKEALVELAQCSYDDLTELLIRWSNETDPPIRRVGSSWYLISKEDSWSLLTRYLTLADMEKFKSVALRVLGTVDPKFNLPYEKQWIAKVIHHSPNYSGLLLRNIADTLAFMGSREDLFCPTLSLRTHASNIIFELFKSAKGNWKVWSTISPVLPLLAEAAPENFLQALEDEMINDKESILNLFTDQEDALFSSSPHTGLLWALETLAWNPDYLNRASMLLAQLCEIDPGGKLSNRPKNSLREIFLPWNPQTAASVDQRLHTLDLLLKKEPNVSWELLCKLLPEFNSIGRNTYKPKYRNWTPDYQREVLVAERERVTLEIINLLTSKVGVSGARWSQIIKAVPMLPLESFDIAIKELSNIVDLEIDSADKVMIWDSLRNLISKHRSFRTADWALTEEQIVRIEEVFRDLEPEEVNLRYSWLFSDWPEFPEGRETDWKENQKKIHNARERALTDIYQSHGIGKIMDLLNCIENSFQFGSILGEIRLIVKEEEDLLERHLDSSDKKMAQFASGYISGSIKKLGDEWAFSILEIAENWEVSKKVGIIIHLAPNQDSWNLVKQLGIDAEREYWSLISPHYINEGDIDKAIENYLNFDLPYSAIELIALHESFTEPEAIVAALKKFLESPGEFMASSSFSYNVSILFKKLMKSQDNDENCLALLEWHYSPVLTQIDHTPIFLHHELARNPNFFAKVISWIYKEEDTDLKEPTVEEQQRAFRAYEILKSWRTIPGFEDDNEVDEKRLVLWVSEAIQALSKMGRVKVGAYNIGEILSTSPMGNDRAWPHEAVRGVIEQFSNHELERGFSTGIYNSRGIISKSLTEGGAQEKKLADRFNAYGDITSARSPRTTAILRSIADTYKVEAREEDIKAELTEDLESFH